MLLLLVLQSAISASPPGLSPVVSAVASVAPVKSPPRTPLAESNVVDAAVARDADVPGVPQEAEPQEAEEERKRKRELAGTAVYIVCGIAFVGALLIVMVVLWGVRVRRQMRRKPPESSPHDPLWYLKTRNAPNPQTPPMPDGPKTTAEDDVG